MKHQEHIVAIPAALISHEGTGLELIEGEINSSDVIIAQRKMLEQNLSYRQIIPYTVLKCGEKYAAYRRNKQGGESRLHGNVSIGFGGHIDLADVAFNKETSVVDLNETINLASKREVAEELRFADNVVIKNITTFEKKIVSNRNEVDSVHIGLVSIMELNTESVTSGEDQLEFMGFFTPSELKEMPSLESWTEGLLAVL